MPPRAPVTCRGSADYDRAMRFAKGHGTENDFVILLDPDGSSGLTAGLTARLCDRRAGIGADGVLRAVRAAACGVAGRADREAGAAAAPRAGMVHGLPQRRRQPGGDVRQRHPRVRPLPAGARPGRRAEFSVATPVRVRAGPAGHDGGITVDMGAVAVLGPGQAVIGGRRSGTAGVGREPAPGLPGGWPAGRVRPVRAAGLDPGQFPEGGNVELVRVTGAGECGHAGTRAGLRRDPLVRHRRRGGAAAAAAGGQRRDLGMSGVPGGDLKVTLEAGRAWLTGPAVIVAEGELDPSWLAARDAAPGRPRRRPGPPGRPAARGWPPPGLAAARGWPPPGAGRRCGPAAQS